MEKSLKKYFPLFVLPTLAAFTIGFIIPFLQGIYLSFTSFVTVDNAKFIGVNNYIKAIGDEQFISAFLFTALFTVVSTVSINLLAFFVALGLTRKVRGTNLFRTVFFMPNLIGGIVLGYIWQILINGALTMWGHHLLDLNSTAGFWGLVILMSWQQVGYMMIIYIAGLQNIPGDLIEAAGIDGANPIQTLFKIKIPMIMSSITICTFLTLTNSFKLYDQNLALTAGNPQNSTEMVAMNIVETFYSRSGPQWKGIGQAKAVLFFIFVAALALIQLRATRSKEVQQ